MAFAFGIGVTLAVFSMLKGRIQIGVKSLRFVLVAGRCMLVAVLRVANN